MKLYSELKNWLDLRSERQATKADNFLKLEAEETAQICEFGGRLYITIFGRPAIDCDGLKDAPLDALKQVRENLYQFNKKNALKHRHKQ